MTRPGFNEFERSAVQSIADLLNRREFRPTEKQLNAIARAWSAGIDADDAACLIALDIEGKTNDRRN